MPTHKQSGPERAGKARPRRLMVAMAHADDMEYYCGGTVAKFVQQGWEVVLTMLSANIAGADLQQDGRYLEHPPEEIAPVREAETHAGAEILGVSTIVQMGFKDSLYYTGQELVFLGDAGYDTQHPAGTQPLAAAPSHPACLRRMRQVLEKYEPQIVITHNFSSGFEHACAASVVNHAFNQAVREGVKLEQLWMPTQVRHGTGDADLRMFLSPNVVIDVTDQWTDKLKALRAHRSQRVEDSIKKVEIIGRYWGLVRGTRYAEPFYTLHDARYR